MKRRPDKRRTTLTLPRESLAAAERLSRHRKTTLSTVVSELIEDGLRARRGPERAAEVLDAYRRAFAGFSEQELLLLDGVVLTDEPGV